MFTASRLNKTDKKVENETMLLSMYGHLAILKTI
jgi:hypothetical protein